MVKLWFNLYNPVNMLQNRLISLNIKISQRPFIADMVWVFLNTESRMVAYTC